MFTAAPFRAFLAKQTCQQTLSAVGRPQGMGRVERLDRSFAQQGLQPEELEPGGSLQPLLDLYRDHYNCQRPHRALDDSTPLEFLHARRYNSAPQDRRTYNALFTKRHSVLLGPLGLT